MFREMEHPKKAIGTVLKNEPRDLFFASVMALVSVNTGAGASALDPARLADAAVHYSAVSAVRSFPVPAVHWRREGLMKTAEERSEIENKIIYPLLLHSKDPVSAIVVEFYPGMENRLGIVAIWSNGRSRESLIPRSVEGTYDAEAYKVLLVQPVP